MKTPDELSKGLGDLQRKLESIEQLESTVSQVSKALCGKENATLEEILQEVNQVKSRLAQAERERDAAVEDARNGTMCDTCKHNNSKDYLNKPCYECNEAFNCWEWLGVCPGNTKEAAST